MANTITNTTVCRALSGFIQNKTSESFSTIGADYRSAQTLPLQKFLNWLAQFLDKNYAARTQSEINYKQAALAAAFNSVAETILKAPLAITMKDKIAPVDIRLNIDQENIQIFSTLQHPYKLFVRHRGNEVELKGVNILLLKEIFLAEYLRSKRQTDGETAEIDLTDFKLTGLHLSQYNFNYCRMPDLIRCDLTSISFNMHTVFKKRTTCQIDALTIDRLQAYEHIRTNMFEVLATTDIDEIRTNNNIYIARPSEYTLAELFSSPIQDLACVKRFKLLHNKNAVKVAFQEIREVQKAGINARIELADVDLSELDLSDMDFQGANMRGSIFNLAIMRHANISKADFHGARLQGAIEFSTKCSATNIFTEAACVNLLVRRAVRKQILKNLCGTEYSELNLSEKFKVEHVNRDYSIITRIEY